MDPFQGMAGKWVILPAFSTLSPGWHSHSQKSASVLTNNCSCVCYSLVGLLVASLSEAGSWKFLLNYMVLCLGWDLWKDGVSIFSSLFWCEYFLIYPCFPGSREFRSFLYCHLSRNLKSFLIGRQALYILNC